MLKSVALIFAMAVVLAGCSSAMEYGAALDRGEVMRIGRAAGSADEMQRRPLSAEERMRLIRMMKREGSEHFARAIHEIEGS